MKEIKINTAEKELYYQGEVIVRYKIEYPEIIDTNNELEKKQFNHESRKAALELKEYAEGELYEQARRMYEYSKKNGNSIIICELVKECEITQNK